MTILDQVELFVWRQKGNAVCDDCIAGVLDLSVRQHANHKTRELAQRSTFERVKDTCTKCGSDKKVIRTV